MHASNHSCRCYCCLGTLGPIGTIYTRTQDMASTIYLLILWDKCIANLIYRNVSTIDISNITKLDKGIFKSHWYLTGVATAQLSQQLSNMNMTFIVYVKVGLPTPVSAHLIRVSCWLLLVSTVSCYIDLVPLWAMVLLSMQLALFYVSTRFRCMPPITATDVTTARGAKSHYAPFTQEHDMWRHLSIDWCTEISVWLNWCIWIYL